MIRHHSPLFAAITLCLLQCACTGGTTRTSGEVHTVVLGPDRSVVLPVHANHIVPGNGAVLDFIAALIGPDRVAALPKASLRYSNIAQADRGAWKSLPEMEGLHLEDLASAKVDLVIAHDWQEAALAPVLNRAGIPVLFLPTVHDVDDILRSMHWVSLALGVPDRGVEQNALLRTRVDSLSQKGAALANLSAMVYSNYGAGGGTAGSGTSYDLMIRLAGLKNAAAEAGIEGHQDLDLEGLLTIQPDIIILSSGPDGSSASLKALQSQLEAAPLKAVERGWIALMHANELTTTSQFTLNAAESLQNQVLGMLPK